MISEKNLLNHEMIGLRVEVVGKPIKGAIVDETKHTFVMLDGMREKIVPKAGNRFIASVGAHRYVFDGNMITQRPYERVKKFYKVISKWQRTLVSKA